SGFKPLVYARLRASGRLQPRHRADSHPDDHGGGALLRFPIRVARFGHLFGSRREIRFKPSRRFCRYSLGRGLRRRTAPARTRPEDRSMTAAAPRAPRSAYGVTLALLGLAAAFPIALMVFNPTLMFERGWEQFVGTGIYFWAVGTLCRELLRMWRNE